MTNKLQVLSDQTKELIELALLEDIGAGDCTSAAVIPEDANGSYAFVAREEMVLCGVEIAQYVISNALAERPKNAGEISQAALIEMTILKHDGARLKVGEIIAEISGNVRDILRKERVALNFLQHLSGVATLTSKYVQEIAHTKAQIFDTRKTTPAFRELEKYAVRCGGGQNHRMGLYDMVLIKDNHIAAAGGIAAAVVAAKNFVFSQENTFGHSPPIFSLGGQGVPKIEIMLEVDNLTQLQETINAQKNMTPNIIMCDNFSLADLSQAVKMVDGKIPLEASGGVNLQTVKAIAETGVDRISTSKITQSAPAVDIGLDEI